jgi:hypothetical protein
MRYLIIIRNVLLLTLFCCLFSFMISCNDNAIDSGDKKVIDNPSLFSSLPDTLDGVFYVSSYSIGNSNQNYKAYGSVYKSRTERHISISGGNATLSDKFLDRSYNSIHGLGETYQWVEGIDGNTSIPTFGGVANWVLEGDSISGVPGFATQMYSPKPINLISPNNYQLSKSSGINIEWNSDPLNTDGVIIFIDYIQTVSNKEDPSLPLTNEYFYKFTSDDGFETITPSELSVFPTNGVVNIFVGRATDKVISVSSKEYYLAATAYSYNEFKLLP